ncbi:MAG: competence/damage-inducible protein A [Candidatus Cloacimonadales bacterium]|jgi:nicotinamide-nucleotide amidase|nr:competence/damage-inducible protein A [Candidatus Cloacimonadales bacterium]
MKKISIAIINIGNELLLGKTVNTNLSWMGNELACMGMEVAKAVIIPDAGEDIRATLKELVGKHSVIIFTGGLGPTEDDITKKEIAEFFGKELIYDDSIWQDMLTKFTQRNRPIPENNKIQAYVPEDFVVLENSRGTAPGLYYQTDDLLLFAVPGVPLEMKHLFTNKIKPILLEKYPTNGWFLQTLNTYGIGESATAELMDDIVLPEDVNIAWLPQTGRVDICVYGSNAEGCKQVYAEIKHILHEWVWGENYQTVAEKVHELLTANNMTLAFAESCTGGLVNKLLTDMAGSSNYLLGGIVSYANEVKENLLNVRKETLESFGAVSEECAKEMAEGLKAKFKADFNVSITGIAGPDGGSEEKPVGLVYMGFAYRNTTEVFKMRFTGNRDSVRLKAAEFVFHQIVKSLEK